MSDKIELNNERISKIEKTVFYIKTLGAIVLLVIGWFIIPVIKENIWPKSETIQTPKEQNIPK